MWGQLDDKSFRQEGLLFLGTGMMTDFLKEVGITEVARDSLKIEVQFVLPIKVPQLLKWSEVTYGQVWKGKRKGKWCVAKYGDPYLEFVLCI